MAIKEDLQITSSAALSAINKALDVLKDTDSAIDDLGDSAEQSSGKSGLLSGALSKIGGTAKLALGGAAAGAAAIGGAMIAAGGAALNFSQETDSAMRSVQAQTGASVEEMEGFREAALGVFESGFGDGVDDIANSMTTVNQALGESGQALEDSTRRAITLSDTFGLDVSESAAIAASAIDSGLVDSSGEAFDLITTGFQEGLNRAGDFGDTLNEYSGDFARLGFSAEEMMSSLNAGLEEGAYNTDVVADGIREFGIRFGAAEEGAVEALESIGVNSEELYQQYEDGEITVADAMETITGALGDVDDKALQAQAGAALFGSKWEDVGADVFLAAGQARDGIASMAGATDEAGQVMQQGLAPALQRLKRTALTSIAPLGDELGKVINKATPHINTFATWMSANIPNAIQQAKAGVDKLQPAFDWLRSQAGDFSDNILPHLREAWDNIQTGFLLVKDVWDSSLRPAFEELAQVLGLTSDRTEGLGGSFGQLVGKILSLGVKALIIGIKVAMEALTVAVNAVSSGVEAARSAFESVATAIANVQAVIQEIRETGLLAWLADALNISIPSFIQRHSPAPLVQTLSNMREEMENMRGLSLPDFGGGEFATAGAGGMTINIPAINVTVAPGGYSPEEAGRRAHSSFVEAARSRGVRV